MEIYDVVKKLVGPIDPLGDSSCDDKRLENLKVMIDLIEKLVGDVAYVSRSRDSHEYSVMLAGKTADKLISLLQGGVMTEYRKVVCVVRSLWPQRNNSIKRASLRFEIGHLRHLRVR